MEGQREEIQKLNSRLSRSRRKAGVKTETALVLAPSAPPRAGPPADHGNAPGNGRPSCDEHRALGRRPGRESTRGRGATVSIQDPSSGSEDERRRPSSGGGEGLDPGSLFRRRRREEAALYRRRRWLRSRIPLPAATTRGAGHLPAATKKGGGLDPRPAATRTGEWSLQERDRELNEK